MSAPRVAVVGGGLAGITAALDCAAAGARVTLVEVRRRLGGAAYSFEREGMRLDNGQHVFLRCCSAYRALLARLGSERHVEVQERLEIPVLSPGKPPVTLRRGTLPPPLHLAGALARYPHLSAAQRFSAALAARALSALDTSDLALDERTLGDWLSDLGQSERSLAALWDLIALPTLNLPAKEASLALGAFVFQTGLLASADAGDIGFHVGTLADAIGDPAERALADAGVEYRLGWRAQALRRVEGGFELQAGWGGREDGQDAQEQGDRAGEGLSAEAVIVALPHARAAGLIEPLLPRQAEAIRGLGSSPIVNLHVVYDRVVCEQHFAAGVDTPVQYLFDRSAAAGAPPGCQYLAVSLSGAEREMQASVAELRERYLPAIAELLPGAREARVESFLATREHTATFRAAPGTAALRPGAATEVPGLALAGTWTATGWPATLESAVMSGHAAARAALGQVAPEAVGA
ncbi:MAG TPA: hydroxysqualene dehydroxylase HpnE [Solirubrobacteraceae bacterium]|nr:hydroxysqualene dehydroxylase HpnE [Solirubrobacteraceae bacterium]